MFSILSVVPSLLVPDVSWHVRPVQYDTMRSTLQYWRQEYDKWSYEYQGSIEMVEWHATSEFKGCLGLYHNQQLRALSQVYKSDTGVVMRSVLTPADEDVAATILIYKMLQNGVEVDWCALKQNPRWYIAASFMATTHVEGQESDA